VRGRRLLKKWACERIDEGGKGGGLSHNSALSPETKEKKKGKAQFFEVAARPSENGEELT